MLEFDVEKYTKNLVHIKELCKLRAKPVTIVSILGDQNMPSAKEIRAMFVSETGSISLARGKTGRPLRRITEKVTARRLAHIVYQFNQLRGGGLSLVDCYVESYKSYMRIWKVEDLSSLRQGIDVDFQLAYSTIQSHLAGEILIKHCPKCNSIGIQRSVLTGSVKFLPCQNCKTLQNLPATRPRYIPFQQLNRAANSK